MVVLLDEIYLIFNNSTGAFRACLRPLSNDLSYIQTGLFLFPPNMVVGGGGGGALPHVFIITN